ncbi:MAG: DUF86 domain-containing protein [Magnetococcales bacterium]|nr:DUF86 domain-containing protein [Magnetococcales bacterium]
MFDDELVVTIIDQMLVAAHRIKRRFAAITVPDDFTSSDDGIDKLDAIVMAIIMIGEGLKNLEKNVGGTFLQHYPEVDWKGVKGARDVLSHHYFDINAEIIFSICRNHIPLLIDTLERMRSDVCAR